MSRQKGIIKLQGTIGGISFYESKGQSLARMSSGPSKNRILTDSTFQRTRENISEFGASATVAKAFRGSLVGILKSVADGQLTPRLLKLMKSVNTKGTGLRGQRAFTLSANRAMVTNVEFNFQTPLSSVFTAPFVAANAADRNDATLTVAAFTPSDYIRIPAGATHFRLIHALGVVSDYTYNANASKYEPSDAALNMLGAVAYSAYTPLISATPATFTLPVALPNNPTMTASVSVLQCVGIDFCQQIGGVNYPLSQANALKVVRVF